MNTRLEMLFDKYNVSEKNRYEINQFFSLLPDNKKQNLLNNFQLLAIRLLDIENELNLERNILIWNEVENIKNAILSWRISNERNEFKKELLDL